MIKIESCTPGTEMTYIRENMRVRVFSGTLLTHSEYATLEVVGSAVISIDEMEVKTIGTPKQVPTQKPSNKTKPTIITPVNVVNSDAASNTITNSSDIATVNCAVVSDVSTTDCSSSSTSCGSD